MNKCIDCKYCDKEGLCTSNGDEECYGDAYEQGRADATRWIPVSERLPEEKIDIVTRDYPEYLVTYKMGDEYHTRCRKYGDKHWWHYGHWCDEYVIAWMRLPEPYREENKE